MIICHCFRLTDGDVRKAVQNASGKPFDYLSELDIGNGCNGCIEAIRELVKELTLEASIVPDVTTEKSDKCI